MGQHKQEDDEVENKPKGKQRGGKTKPQSTCNECYNHPSHQDVGPWSEILRCSVGIKPVTVGKEEELVLT